LTTGADADCAGANCDAGLTAGAANCVAEFIGAGANCGVTGIGANCSVWFTGAGANCGTGLTADIGAIMAIGGIPTAGRALDEASRGRAMLATQGLVPSKPCEKVSCMRGIGGGEASTDAGVAGGKEELQVEGLLVEASHGDVLTSPCCVLRVLHGDGIFLNKPNADIVTTDSPNCSLA